MQAPAVSLVLVEEEEYLLLHVGEGGDLPHVLVQDLSSQVWIHLCQGQRLLLR